jgi:hypothetical protein
VVIWPNSLITKLGLLVIFLAVAFRVAVPAYTEYKCVSAETAFNNACLFAGTVKE